MASPFPSIHSPEFKKIIPLISLLLIFSCSKGTRKRTAAAGRISPTYQGPAEPEYCSGPMVYSDSVRVTGKGQYQARESFYENSSSGGLGAPGSPRPIRHAEVRVTNSSGVLLQCGETDELGTFGLSLPRGDGIFTLSINSRANNQFLKASVLNAPEQNLIYGLKVQVIATANQDLGALTALATTEDGLLGGAFNILDQLHNANDFIRSKAGSCGSHFVGCPNFTVAPKVAVYWEPGFNPGSYFEGASALSFYIPGFSRLFILGGVNGDINYSDTDHFDNSVIIHEFGHFLEDSMFVSDSPGGEHNGNRVIDPRLAWSEGWGNFLQAAVRGDGYYLDTAGNISGSTNFMFRIDLEPNGASAANDRPQFDGEGNFREFSVTRLLFDVNDSAGVDAGNDNDSIDNGFGSIWAALVMSGGFARSSLKFRDVSVLHDFVHNRLSPTQDWSPLRTSEKHVNSSTDFRAEYGRYVTTTAGGCHISLNPYTITPYNSSSDSGNFSTSHLLKNNEFYHYKHSGGPLQLTLNYVTSSGTEADLDLYIYNSSARYGASDDMVGYSREEPATPASGNIETENISISSLPPGDYLINLMVFTGGASVGSETQYEMKLGGVNLCPDSLP